LLWAHLCSPWLHGQQTPALGKRLEELMMGDSIQKARELLEGTVEQKIRLGDYGSLAKLVYWVGKLELAGQGDPEIPKARELAENIIESSRDNLTLYHTHSNLAKLHNETGNAGTAYTSGVLALDRAKALGNPVFLADTQYNLGEYALRSGDLDRFASHTRS